MRPLFSEDSKIAPQWDHLKNKAMARKLSNGDCIDLSKCERLGDDYIITNFVEGVDYCNAETEQWIWSIGRNLKTCEILASHEAKFYQNLYYTCIWLR